MKKKNVILLMCDQMAQSVITDNSQCIMPNAKELIKDSVFCSRSYSSNAICSPARASLISGMLPHNHGMVDCTHAVPKYRAEYDEKLDTFTRVLKRNGYHSCYYGKWHIERSEKLENYGFDDYLTEHQIPSQKFSAIKKTIISTHDGYDDKAIGGVYSEDKTKSEEYFIYSKGIDFIEQVKNKDNPFFVFLSTYAPHDPYTVPKEIYDMYDGVDIELPLSYCDSMEDKPSIYRRIQRLWKTLTPNAAKEIKRYYYSYCTLVDTQIGRLVKYLKENDLYSDTLIVLLSDHGDLQGAHNLFCKGVFGFEEGYKIPLVFKLPQEEYKNTICEAYMSICDVGPTILDILNCDKYSNSIDGKSIVPYLNNSLSTEGTSVMAEFFGQRYSYTQRIVWKDNFKYVFNGFDFDELYDLNNDPDEMINQAENPKYHDKLVEMAKLLQQKIYETGDKCINEAQYYMHRFLPIGPIKSTDQSDFTIYNKEF